MPIHEQCGRVWSEEFFFHMAADKCFLEMALKGSLLIILVPRCVMQMPLFTIPPPPKNSATST